MAKQDPASKFLAEIIAIRRRYVRTPPRAEVDLNDPVQWAAAARKALTLTPSNFNFLNEENALTWGDHIIQRAFAALILDYRNPQHWHSLVHWFAVAHFRAKRKRGGARPGLPR
jgi:hypothetical protein